MQISLVEVSIIIEEAVVDNEAAVSIKRAGPKPALLFIAISKLYRLISIHF